MQLGDFPTIFYTARMVALDLWLVEDRRDPPSPLAQVLARSAPEVNVTHCASAAETVARLQTSDVALPQVILMVLQSAWTESLGLIKLLKADPDFRQIQVMVLAPSDDPAQVRETYVSYANSYIVQASSLAETERQVRAFLAFWQIIRPPEPMRSSVRRSQEMDGGTSGMHPGWGDGRTFNAE